MCRHPSARFDLSFLSSVKSAQLRRKPHVFVFDGARARAFKRVLENVVRREGFWDRLTLTAGATEETFGRFESRAVRVPLSTSLVGRRSSRSSFGKDRASRVSASRWMSRSVSRPTGTRTSGSPNPPHQHET